MPKFIRSLLMPDFQYGFCVPISYTCGKSFNFHFNVPFHLFKRYIFYGKLANHTLYDMRWFTKYKSISRSWLSTNSGLKFVIIITINGQVEETRFCRSFTFNRKFYILYAIKLYATFCTRIKDLLKYLIIQNLFDIFQNGLNRELHLSNSTVFVFQ